MQNTNPIHAGVVRINITVPHWIVSELKKEVPKRGKSSFVTAAIKEKLAREKREKAFKKLAELPPTFVNITDSDRKSVV